MPKDAFIELDRCSYCDRPAVKHWDGGLRSCRLEVCESLAYAASRRSVRLPRPERHRLLRRR